MRKMVNSNSMHYNTLYTTFSRNGRLQLKTAYVFLEALQCLLHVFVAQLGGRLQFVLDGQATDDFLLLQRQTRSLDLLGVHLRRAYIIKLKLLSVAATTQAQTGHRCTYLQFLLHLGDDGVALLLAVLHFRVQRLLRLAHKFVIQFVLLARDLLDLGAFGRPVGHLLRFQ